MTEWLRPGQEPETAGKFTTVNKALLNSQTCPSVGRVSQRPSQNPLNHLDLDAQFYFHHA